MIRMINVRRRAALLTITGLVLSAVLIQGCRRDGMDSPVGTTGLNKISTTLAAQGMSAGTQVTLVANSGTYMPKRIDGDLLNAWGIAINPNNGIVWIAANHSGKSVVYDQGGNQIRLPVIIPTSSADSGGAPSGIVFNTTNQFIISSTSEVSKFIFSSEDGTILAWSSGSHAKVVADRSGMGAVYKGLALAPSGSRFFLYATNFKGNRVDVFDDHFQYDSTFMFQDPSIPAGFAPFNIQNIGGLLYVTYAKQKGPDNQDDQAGPGNGYIDIYRPDGMLITRFASQGTLNSPWGLAAVPGDGHGQLEHAILVGNFGDGRINIFDKHGKYVGQVSDSTGQPITVKGLWGLMFGRPAVSGQQGNNEDEDGMEESAGHDSTHRVNLFFTAGPNDENDGVFGTIRLSRRPAGQGHDDQGENHQGNEGDDDDHGNDHANQGGDDNSGD